MASPSVRQQEAGDECAGGRSGRHGRRGRCRGGRDRPAGRVSGRGALDPGRRRQRARRDLPEPGRRLHELPAALPLPHHRQAARAVLDRCGARHGGAQGARGPLRPARGRAHPRARPRPDRAGVGVAARGRAGGGRDVRRRGRAAARRVADQLPRRGRPLLHARGPAAARARRARALRRDAARVQAAAARVRRPRRHRPRRRHPGGRLQERALARASASRARRCSS